MPQTLIDAIKQAQKEQNWQKVIELCGELHQQSPEKWESLWWAGHAHKNLRQYIQAEEWFTKLKTAFPNRHLGLEGWVNVAEHQQNWAEMSQRVDAFEAQYPDLWHVPFWRGMIAKNTQRFDEAERHYALLAQKRSDWHVGWEEPVKMAFQRGDYHRAIELNPIFQAAFPHLWQSYWWVGQSYKNLGLYDEAMAQFAQLKEKFPDNHRGWEGEINIAQHQQNWQRVVELATEFQAAFPQMWQGFWWAGQAHKNLAQYDLAAQQFGLLKEKFPKQHQGLEGEINIAQHQQNWQRVIELATAFQAAFPQMWQGFWWTGQAHKNLYQYEQAKLVFQTLMTRFPNHHQGYEGLVNIYEHQHHWQAILLLSGAFRQHFPHLWQSYYWEGSVYRNLGQYDEAQTVFQTMTQDFPNLHHGWNGLIDVANDQADWENALSWCDLAIESLPNYLPFYQRKGRALIDLKQFDVAETHFMNLQKQYPNESMPLFGLADVYAAQRKKEKEKMVLLTGALRFPERENMVQRLIHHLNHHGEADLAQDIYQKYIRNHNTVTNLIIQNNFYRLQFGNQGNVDFRAQLFQQYPHDLTFARRYANILIKYVEEF